MYKWTKSKVHTFLISTHVWFPYHKFTHIWIMMLIFACKGVWSVHFCFFKQLFLHHLSSLRMCIQQHSIYEGVNTDQKSMKSFYLDGGLYGVGISGILDNWICFTRELWALGGHAHYLILPPPALPLPVLALWQRVKLISANTRLSNSGL